MEGLIHPRAGTTVLQTDRSHPYHPATKQSEPSIDLGMPRLWSALVPESYVQQPPVTDSSVQPVESEAAASAAKEVLAAGQVYNEAMRQLETALRGKDSGRNGTGGASHVTKNAASAALEPLADRPVHVPDQTTCAEATSMKPLPIHVPYQAVEQPESIHRQVESHLTNRSAVQPHEPAQQQLEAADLKHNHVSTEQKVEDRMDDGFISLLPISGLASSMQVEHKLDQVVNMLADAESSDSQGELPDIDSGASDSDDDASE